MSPKTEVEIEVDKVLDQLPAMINANDLYREFIGLTDIERFKEEDYVLRSLLRGHTRAAIIRGLQEKHPDGTFTVTDFEKFLARNQEVVKSMGKEVTMSARRHLAARAQCGEMLAGLALYTQKMITEFRAEGDNTNTVAAIRALNSTLENYMKLEGMVGPENEGGKVVNIINTISDNKTRLKDKIHNANFVDADTGDIKNG